MAIQIFNTLTRKKEEFVTIEPDKVRMYCCGPTVYGLLHVGNFRGAIFYNFLRNFLERSGYQVNFVYNFTDVDDKIIDRAKKENVESTVISEKYISEFKSDYERLKLRPHTQNPKVTEYMEPIKDMVKSLLDKEKAYVAEGEVLYSIKSFPEYGKLSNRNPDELKTGVRIDVDAKKKDPLDFALWKPSKPGEPAWDSQWGAGRPGWHIECSAMAKALLGDQIDIHGGGMDLIFPHHENEIAQSEGATGKRFVRYWVHNNMINFSGAKMSKSLGNIKTARDFMDEYNPEILKYMILSVHYRSVSDFGESAVEHAIHGLARIYSSLAAADSLVTQALSDFSDTDKEKLIAFKNQVQAIVYRSPEYLRKGEAEKHSDAKLALISTLGSEPFFKFDEILKNLILNLFDDFNTPEAMARIFESVRSFNSKFKRGQKMNLQSALQVTLFMEFVRSTGEMLALFQEAPAEYLIVLDDMLLRKKSILRSDIDKLVADRAKARAEKNFPLSDQLRDQLMQLGIAVSDTPLGTVWEVQK